MEKAPLYRTREFMTVVIDLVVSSALYFGAKYLAPGVFEDVKWAIAALQPVAFLLVAHFAVDRAEGAVDARIRALFDK